MTRFGPVAAANLWGRVLRRARRTVEQYRGGSPAHRPPEAVDRDRERAKEYDRGIWREVARSLEPHATLPATSDDTALLRASRLVDEEWYAEQIGDPVTDAVDHYLSIGADLGLDPHPLFDTDWYRHEHAGYLPSDQNPLVHYLREGHLRGLPPSPHVDLDELRLRLGTKEEPLALLLRLRAEVDVHALQSSLRAARPASTPLDDTELRWRDLIEDRITDEESFVLYRILGNDLPPRHKSGQSEHNLRFLLDEEPELPGCEKRYVVNRIIDPAIEARLIELLDSRGAAYVHIPFVAEDYRRIGWRVSDFAQPGLLYGTRHDALPATSRARALDHAYHDKNRYVMHNNGGRNRALADGRPRARWVLPFDGNCFFTRSAWAELRESVLAAPHRRYVLVPMSRVNQNELLLDPDTVVAAAEEPQIAFRCDADEAFDEDRRYGRRPKVELLYRLGEPGPWDAWPDEPWEAPRPEHSPDAGEQHTAGWVARMASGAPKLEVDSQQRMLSRMEAIRGCLRSVDEGLIRRCFDATQVQTRSERLLERQRRDGTVAGVAIDQLVDRELGVLTQANRSGPRHFGGGPPDALQRLLVVRAFGGWLLDDAGLLERARRTVEVWAAREAASRLRRAPHLGDVLDAVVLLQRVEAIDPNTVSDVRGCVERRYRWLCGSRTAARTRRSPGVDGTCYEIEMLACQAHLDDVAALSETFARVAARCHDRFHEFSPDSRSRPRHDTLGTLHLQVWLRLLRLQQRYEVTLLDERSNSLEGLQRACRAAIHGAADERARDALINQLGAIRWPSGDGQWSPMPRPISTSPGFFPLWWAGTYD
jgi:hypothetical protein